MTTQRFHGLLCRAVRDSDVAMGFARLRGTKMSFSEKWMEVYGIPPGLVVHTERDHEKQADVIWYKEKP